MAPVYEYECAKKHRTERYAALSTPGEPVEWVYCDECKDQKKRGHAHLVPSVTGAPKFKRGIGGFHSPNA